MRWILQKPDVVIYSLALYTISINTGAASSTHIRNIEVWAQSNLSSTSGPYDSVLLATLQGQANALHGVSGRRMHSRISFDRCICKLVIVYSNAADIGLQHGHLKCSTKLCPVCTAAYHGSAGNTHLMLKSAASCWFMAEEVSISLKGWRELCLHNFLQMLEDPCCLKEMVLRKYF